MLGRQGNIFVENPVVAAVTPLPCTVARMISIGSTVLRVDDLQRQVEFWTEALNDVPRAGDADDFVLLNRGTAPNRTSRRIERARSSG